MKDKKKIISRIGFHALLLLVMMVARISHAESWRDKADPFEGFNRASYWLTEEVDQLLVRPVAVVYDKSLPSAAQTVVANFYSNLLEVPSFVSDILQAKWKYAAQGGGRFIINTTLGAGGMFDVATRIGISKHREDLGQTLGYWGVPPGPYIFIPLLGPSSVRDGAAYFFDTFLTPYRHLDAMSIRNSMFGVDVIQKRDALLPAEKHILGDKYVFMRDYYLNHRRRLIADGQELEGEEADFGDEFEDF